MHDKRVTVLLLSSISLLTGCSQSKRDSESQSMGEWMFPIQIALRTDSIADNCEASFSWQGYDCQESNSDAAEYVWNGEYVGSGSEGFAKILGHVRHMRENGTLLIHDVDAPLFEDASGSPPPCDYPFINEYQEFLEIGRARQLVFIYWEGDLPG